MGIDNLPDGWEWSRIGDLCFVTKLAGFEFTKYVKYVEGGEIPVIRAQNVSRQGFQEGNFVYVNRGVYESLTRSRLQGGEVLIAFVGSVGNVGIAPKGKEFFLGPNVALIRVDEKSIYNKYLHYFLQSDEGKAGVLKFSKSTTQSSISMANIRDVVFPHPSLPEQERIVSRIEELFSDLEAGVVALERVHAGLKRYKASVLKAAVEGKLLNGKSGIVEGELPDGWRWSTVAGLAANERNSITDGPFGSKLKTEHYKESGPRVIRLQNIGDGEFRDEKAHISQEHFETLRKHQVFGGDLVIAGLGESLPRACMIPEYVGDAIVKADCIRFKTNPELAENKYLLYALNSETVKKLSAKIIHGIGRPRMNQQEIKAIPIPLPPLEEQRLIVAEVERRLSVVGEVESAVEAGLVRAARLRQSILRHAFEGRL